MSADDFENAFRRVEKAAHRTRYVISVTAVPEMDINKYNEIIGSNTIWRSIPKDYNKSDLFLDVNDLNQLASYLEGRGDGEFYTILELALQINNNIHEDRGARKEERKERKVNTDDVAVQD